MKNNVMVLETIIVAWKNVRQGSTEIIHFNSNSSSNFISLTEEFLEKTAQDNTRYFYHKTNLQKQSTYHPFAPFSDFIFELKSDELGIQEIIDKADIFPIQKETIEEYFSTGIAKREAPLIFDETKYEQKQLIRSMASIIIEISKIKPIIFCIANLHNGSSLTLSLLKYLQKNNHEGEILFLLDFNMAHYINDNSENQFWEQYLSLTEESSFVIELEDKKTKIHNKSWNKQKPLTNSSDMLELAQTNFALLSFHEAKIIGLELLSQIEKKEISFSKEKHQTLLKLIGISFFYLKEPEIAIHYFQIIADLAIKEKKDSQLAFAYRYMGLAYLLNRDIDAAKKFILLAMDLTKNTANEKEYILTLFTYYSISNSITENIPIEMYRELITLLEKYSYENLLALCLSNSFLYVEEGSALDNIENDIERAIDIAHRNKNVFGLSVYYHRLGIIYENQEKYERAFHVYLKSKELNKELHNPLKMIRANNGLGYLFLLQEKYKKTFDYYLANLELLSKINDYNEIMLSLFNFGILFIFTRSYQNAIDLFQKVLKIMKIMKMEQIPFQTRSNILIFKAFCHYKIGQKQKAFQELQVVMSRFKKNHYELTGESTLFYYLLLGFYEQKHNPDNKKVFDYFMKAKNSLDDSQIKNKAFLSIFYIEYIEYLQSRGERETAEFVLEKGINNCKELKFEVNKNWLYSAFYKNKLIPIEFKEKIEFKFNALVEIARREITLSRLNKKNREIDFINLAQDIFNNNETKAVIAKKILELIIINFHVQEGYVHIIKDNEWKEVASEFPAESEPIFLLPHIQKLRGNKLEDFTIDITKLRKWLPRRFTHILSFPGITSKEHIINLFLGATKKTTPLNKDEIKIISIVFQQMKLVFEKIDTQNKLLLLSKIDPLTGLFNRDSLLNRIEEEAKRLTRYIGKTTKRNLCVSFIDLDNFRYYNKNFGRDIGDIILKGFSALLKKNYREVDFLSRYGGNEFLIILPETNEEEAYQSANRLIDSIKKADFFHEKIEDSLQEKIAVPEDKRLVLSIGIAQLSEMEAKNIDIETLIAEAHEALDQVKGQGKGGIQLKSKM